VPPDVFRSNAQLMPAGRVTRLVRRLAIVLAGTLQSVGPVVAQEWPARPITMVIPFAAGGAPDLLGRILAPELGRHLGQTVIIENAGGAGGMAGSARVAKAASDGYQLVLGSSGSHAVTQTLFRRPLYNAATDFTPVALIADQPVLLVVRKDLPVSTLSEFVDYARGSQAEMQYGSAGPGSGTHLACMRLNMALGIRAAHVPYRGGTPAMQDLVAGRIDYQCTTSSAVGYIESKAVKAIAVLATERTPLLPQIPSAQEQGLAGFGAEVWFGVFLPRGTPAPIVTKLNTACLSAMGSAAFAEQVRRIAASVVAPWRRSPEYLQKFVESEIEKWAGPIKASGISLD